MINFLIILLGVPILRKYLQTETNVPKWDYYLKILRVFGPILFLFSSLSDDYEYAFELLWDGIFLFLIYVLYELRKKRIAQVLLRATAPLVGILVLQDLLSICLPGLAKEFDSQLNVALVFGILWLFAFGIGASNQHKSFLAEQKKREEEEAERHLLEAKKLELEYQVTERTAELVKQKEELLHALEDLKTTQNQLIQKEKLASLGELTAGIAHEIQNPLNFVNNFSELSVELAQELIEELEKPEIDKLYLAEILGDLTKNQEKINHHGKRASSIVKGMLEHSRTSTGEREMTDINKLADEYLRLSYHGMRARFKDFNADYELIADESLPLVNCVPQDMGRVLLNLINNAFYACTERSRSAVGHRAEGVAGGVNAVPKVTISTKKLPSSEGQGRPTLRWVNEQGSDENLTAIVLGDENLLMPVMYSLDESVTDFNVTMGISLKNSMLFTLIDAIFELQRNMVEFRSKSGEKVRIPKFNHRHIEKVLNHPFIRRYELIYYESSFTPLLQREKGQGDEVNQPNSPSTNPIRATLKAISKEGKVFLSDQEIKDLGSDEPLFEVLFTRWNNDPRTAVEQFEKLINRLRVVYRENKDAIETEYLYLFYTLLKRLKVIVNERKEIVTLKTFRNFLYELIRQTKIPFSGEPIADLQIMGMLETRCLDFERVIIMSVNEGILPSGKKQNSLIPFEACVEFGLPTHNDQDTVMSYHFFRLLQRASEIVLIHTQPAGEGQKNEKSRFLLQIEHELAKTNKHIKLSKPSVKFKAPSNETDQEVELVIAKTPEILDYLKTYLSDSFDKKDKKNGGIYATHLNQFIRCSLQYYFNRVAGIAQEEDVEETLGADGFGTWIHATLERIDIEYTSQTHLLNLDNIHQIIKELPERLQADFAAKFSGQTLDEGSNFLLYQIAQNLLKSFFENQLNTDDLLPMEVLGTEKLIKQAVELQANGQAVTALVAGKIDRIERLHRNLLRVVDYKTGKVEQKDLLVKSEDIEENLLTNADTKKWDKVRQLWLYKYLVLKKMLGTDGLLLGGQRLRADENKVVAGIYSFRNIGEGFLTNNMEFEKGESAEQFIAQSEVYLSQFVSRLLDPTEPFRRTDDLEKCQYCDYRGICGR